MVADTLQESGDRGDDAAIGLGCSYDRFRLSRLDIQVRSFYGALKFGKKSRLVGPASKDPFYS